MTKKENNKIANFLFEMGTMRRIPRAHRQTLMVDDNADNIASHSYRVALIGWFLAKMEKKDPYKVITMCLVHDMSEVRAGDQNYVHKNYVKVFENEIIKEQLGELPFKDLEITSNEYNKRKSREAIVAKDADLIDQILLLKEYAWQGNKEAEIWLKGKAPEKENIQFTNLKTKSGKGLAKVIMKTPPSNWFNNLHTHKNR